MENKEILEEEKRPNIVQQAGYAGATLAAAGAVDMLAHLGPTGIVVGGILAYVAYRHGPELVEGVRSHLPAMPVAHVHTSERIVSGERSVLDRALGRFPSNVSEPQDVVHLYDRRMRLSPDWIQNVEKLVGLGVVCYGIKGSGKTNFGALLAEQFGQFYIPLVIFDKEGDYTSLVDVLPHGYIAGAPEASRKYKPEQFLAVDMGVAEDIGEAILESGYQVVFDLRSYPDDIARARIMSTVVQSLMRHAESVPNADRVPCLAFTDEASHWFPQDRSMSFLPTLVQTELLRTFIEMSNTGRKRGIIPAWFDQRPANFDKRLAAESDIYVYMRQRQDVDLKRYANAIGIDLALQAKTFEDGEGVVSLPKGEPFLTMFNERKSKHISHTPRAEAAIKRFGTSAVPVPGTVPSTVSSSTQFHAPLKRRHKFTPSTAGTIGTGSENKPQAQIEEAGPVPGTVPTTEERKRFTVEQETEFIRRYKASGSIREAIAQMHISYGRYQQQASMIVKERNLRRA